MPCVNRDPLALAKFYKGLLDSGTVENRAALARYLGVSRSRVTQVLRRLDMATTPSTHNDAAGRNGTAGKEGSHAAG
jgi:hypothetical protein